MRSPERPGWRLAVSKIRIASPPIEVGRIWPAVYETKYARVSHQNRSMIPCAASSHFQRNAIGSAVPIMITTASPNHQRFAALSTSHVWWMSILRTMYATARVVKRMPRRMRSGRLTCDSRGTRGVLIR